jgi:FMN phosphatase YigB (HAD superfamily)
MIASIVQALRRTTTAQRIEVALLSSWRQKVISSSPYFDSGWYLDNNDDLRSAGVDPLDHFLHHGEREGRSPGPMFDSTAYEAMHPDAEGAALTHFHQGLLTAKFAANTNEAQEIIERGLPAIESQWFDEAWYRNTHASGDPTVFQAEHPLVHYHRTGLDPSPVFDQHDYQSQLDTDGADERPLDHWLAHTASQTNALIRPRVVSRASSIPLRDRPLVQHRVRPRSELESLDVCVMVHAYYLDVLPSLLRRLALLPAAPALFVSVTTTSDASEAHRTIDTVLGPNQPRIIKVVPNRGRNFAPLLCSFADEIRDHDYLLHVHTKKSLHVGEELAAWRTHLLRSLLPTAPGVDAILSLMADDPTVGVVQAPTWESVPHYGNYWLDNSPRGAELYTRLGVDDRRASGYVSYPVGGMFWAKVDALRPLLDLGLTVGDFDRELSQTDSTLAHAIERTIPAAAAVAGFDTVEFDYSAAQWRRNWSEGNAPECGSANVEALRVALGSAELISVDLFDTLVLRPALDPEALFEVLGLQFDAAASVSHGAANRPSEPAFSGGELVRLRQASESRLRNDRSFVGDVTLDEIYATTRSQDPSQAEPLERLKQLEINLERRAAIPQTWLIDELLNDRARRAGRSDAHARYVLITDTTQPVNNVKQLLTQIGAGDLFDETYVSNACRARKDTGSMWELVQTREQPKSGRWLHIGHDAFSDVKQAVERGIDSFHVPAPASIAQSRGVDSSLLGPETRTGTQLVAGHGLAVLAARSQPTESALGMLDDATLDEFGYGVLGPITLSFVNWLTHTARDRNIDRLIFISPGAGLALNVVRQLRPYLPDDVVRFDDVVMSRPIDLTSPQHQGEHLGIVDIDASGADRQAFPQITARAITELYYVDDLAADQSDRSALSCFTRDTAHGSSNLISTHTPAFRLLCSATHPHTLPRRVETAQAGAIRFVHDHIERFGPELLGARVEPTVVLDALEQTVRDTMPEIEAVLSEFAIGASSTSPVV